MDRAAKDSAQEPYLNTLSSLKSGIFRKMSEKNQFTGIVRDVILQCRSFCAEKCEIKVSVDKDLSLQPVLWGRKKKELKASVPTELLIRRKL